VQGISTCFEGLQISKGWPSCIFKKQIFLSHPTLTPHKTKAKDLIQ
jgi:hypothetical protein